ncbi:hypothetical protein HYU21_02510 [Candidatus Woesearchaeota archaeon]|nr:hypothetical protein [Candidatus Woesearchaeota archaeon]
MDAKGITQDTDSLIYTGLATSLLRGVVGIRAAKIHNRDPYFNIDSLNVGKKISPITEGIKQSSVGAVISALEITVGYAVGWSLAKII